MLRNYHIFISHSWDYSYHYETIKSWLTEAPYFTWTNYSVPITNPLDVNSTRELKQKLFNRISNSSCVIILSAMYAKYSRWIDFEIDTAVAMDPKSRIISTQQSARLHSQLHEEHFVSLRQFSRPALSVELG